MKAFVLDETGGKLTLRDIPKPAPGPGHVLVKVSASGVNPLDLKIVAGAAAHAKVVPPAVLGIDLAGVVEAVGHGVTGFAAGDEVYGMTGGVGDLQGSLAEYAAVDADLLAHKPRTLSMIEAAALPLSVVTAWEGLIDRADVDQDDTVLVHGGAGGVGHIAVQLALSRGAKVFATGTGASLGTIAGFGATPLDYTTDYSAAGPFDVIFDTVGGAVLDQSFAMVTEYTGRVVSILGWGAHSLAPLSFRGASYSGVFTLMPLLTGRSRAHHGKALAGAAAMADAGDLTPLVHPEKFDWTSVAAAHEMLAGGKNQGKVVIDLLAL